MPLFMRVSQLAPLRNNQVKIVDQTQKYSRIFPFERGKVNSFVACHFPKLRLDGYFLLSRSTGLGANIACQLGL
jgi:hypothetical protein